MSGDATVFSSGIQRLLVDLDRLFELVSDHATLEEANDECAFSDYEDEKEEAVARSRYVRAREGLEREIVNIVIENVTQSQVYGSHYWVESADDAEFRILARFNPEMRTG